MSRFAVDPAQVARVQRTALHIFDSIAADTAVSEAHRRMLSWATELHETGLSLSHESYQRHSAYLVEASDMAGFSRQEQLFLATLVGLQRRDIPPGYASRLPGRLHQALNVTLLCVRLAWIFCRTREDAAIPGYKVKLDDRKVYLALPHHWVENHPLTIADLRHEIKALAMTGLQLDLSYVNHEPD